MKSTLEVKERIPNFEQDEQRKLIVEHRFHKTATGTRYVGTIGSFASPRRREKGQLEQRLQVTSLPRLSLPTK